MTVIGFAEDAIMKNHIVHVKKWKVMKMNDFVSAKDRLRGFRKKWDWVVIGICLSLIAGCLLLIYL